MKKSLVIGILVIPTLLWSSESIFENVTPHGDNYFISGDKSSQIKSQLSFKYKVFDGHPLYLGYTQLMFWRAYDIENSSPMSDVNFSPEIFYRKDAKWGFLQLTPFDHRSNGAPSGSSDRDYNRFGASAGSSFDFWKLQLFYALKVYHIYYVNDRNSDIRDYLGYTEAKVGLKFNEDGKYFDREELSVRLISGFNGKGAREWNLKFRPLLPDFSPFFYVQIWEGYGEGLLDYNVYNKAYRVGLIFQ